MKQYLLRVREGYTVRTQCTPSFQPSALDAALLCTLECEASVDSRSVKEVGLCWFLMLSPLCCCRICPAQDLQKGVLLCECCNPLQGGACAQPPGEEEQGAPKEVCCTSLAPVHSTLRIALAHGMSGAAAHAVYSWKLRTQNVYGKVAFQCKGNRALR